MNEAAGWTKRLEGQSSCDRSTNEAKVERMDQSPAPQLSRSTVAQKFSVWDFGS